MRRLLLVLTVAAVMAAMVVALAVPAFAAPNENASQQCKDDPLFSSSSHGGCVSFFETPGHNTTANGATACQDPDYRDFIGSISNGPVNNHGQCMTARKEL